ncbi:hypothetical protein ABFB09_01715 [Dehalogenimonas sp. THU2]|uniref:hypothetical protein n=1 Tax=Dehalogenimonas sp. THU2 TaxID=3151121 RepID=UPI0032189B83
MKTAGDTYLLLWGGKVSPSSAKRVMYWATNHEGTLCGIIMPMAAWQRVEQTLKATTDQTPYLGVAVTGLKSDSPELKLVTISADYLYDFCYLKNAIYRFRQTPDKLKLKPDKVMGHVGLAEIPPLATLRRFGKPDKGEFFTFMPDKTRLELYYLIEEGETPPAKLDVQVLWGLKGFSLPQASRRTGQKPPEFEKAVLENSVVKPLPLWMRRLSGIGRRRRRGGPPSF